MSEDRALAKRIRRRVAGRDQQFFAITAPGLEAVCGREMTAREFSGVRVQPGGVRFVGRLPELYRANLWLHTASRILMRVHRFSAAHFGQLEQQLNRIDWDLFLPPGAELRARVSLHAGRIFHSAAVAERVLTAAGAGRGGAGDAPDPPPPQGIYVRAVRNRFVVSLDSSGELLYRRGIKTHGGPAPLRETLAAAVLRLAGWTGRTLLVNPMCGSGTLALEAALMAQSIPPGRYREFAFQHWPGFQPGRWRHLGREARRRARITRRTRVLASDSDAGACRRLAEILEPFDWASAVHVERRDFFELEAPRPQQGPGMLVLNPPYGFRLGDRRRARRMIARIGQRLRAEWRGWALAVLSPEADGAARLGLPLSRRPLLHGGRRLYLYRGRVS